MKKDERQLANFVANINEKTWQLTGIDTLGDRIVLVRVLSGLKRDEIAKRLNVTGATFTNYTGNKRLPSSDFLTLLCSEFNVNPAWLLMLQGPVFSAYNADYPQLSPSDVQPSKIKDYSCTNCECSKSDLDKEREMSRELVTENRELNKENRELMRENGDLRVELAEIKARAAPDQETPNEAHRKAG